MASERTLADQAELSDAIAALCCAMTQEQQDASVQRIENLFASVRRSISREIPPHEQKDDHGAGLIGQPIPTGAGTEPRPNNQIASRPPNLADAAEMLWTVLANVSGGNWNEQSPEWQDAAARWRDYYFSACPIGSGTEATPAERAGERTGAQRDHPDPRIGSPEPSD